MINRSGMQMQRIPAGEFVMGNAATPAELASLSPGYERRRPRELVDEALAHRVRITRLFYMARHEVMVSGSSAPSARLRPCARIDRRRQRRRLARRLRPGPQMRAATPSKAAIRATPGATPGFAQGDEHPVVNVT